MKTVLKVKLQLNKHRLTEFSDKYITGHMSEIVNPVTIIDAFNDMTLPDALHSLLNVSWNSDTVDANQTHVGEIADTGRVRTHNNLALLLNDTGDKLLIIAEAKPTEIGLLIVINIGYSGSRSNLDIYLKELNIDINECEMIYVSDE